MLNRTIFSAALAAGLVLAADAQAKEKWIFNIFVGPKHLVNHPLKKEWAPDVMAATKGEVEITFLPTSAAPPPKQIDGVASGQFDGAFIFHGFTAKRAIGTRLGILPFLASGKGEALSVAYWRTYEKFFADKREYDDDGIQILSVFQFTGGNFYSGTDKPILSIADMKARKMWVLAGTPSQTLKGVGVKHVSGPAARVSQFTQTNVVQGLAGFPREGIVAFGALEFTKSTTVTSGAAIMIPSFALFVSKKKWDALSPALQKAVMSVSGEKVARAVGKRADIHEVKAHKTMNEKGIVDHTASKAFENELRAAGKPVVKAWLQQVKKLGVDGNEAIKFYRRQVSATN